jgi:hypothetical protein
MSGTESGDKAPFAKLSIAQWDGFSFRYPLARKLDSPQEFSGLCAENKHFFPLSGTNPLFSNYEHK